MNGPRTQIPGRPSERGFSMLEVLISSVIFLIGFGGLAAMHTYAAGFDGHAQKIDQATAVAWDLLSYLESVPFGDGTEPASANVNPVLTDKQPANDNDAAMRDVMGLFAKDTAPTATDYDHDEQDLDAVDAANSSAVNPCSGFTTPVRTCLFHGYEDVAFTSANPNRPSLDFNHNGQNDFQRYWLIENKTDANGNLEGVLISVVVRWRTTTGTYRRVVLTGYRANPDLISKMP